MAPKRSGKDSEESDSDELEWLRESHADALDYVDKLIDENADLRRENARLTGEVERLQRENADLRRVAVPQIEPGPQYAPPLPKSSSALAEDGETVRYLMKNPWTDGTVEIQLSGVELVEKMAAAVPPPRGHLTRYLGVLAPNSGLRSSIVPVPKPKARAHGAQTADQLTKAQRVSWARLAMHAFHVDLNICELCGGQVRRLAVITDPFSAARFLRCTERARPPPEGHRSRTLEVH